MVIDGSENVLIGGQSFLETSTGEGFVMLVDKYGEVVFANTYNGDSSGNNTIHKVALQGDGTTFTAVGSTLVVESNSGTPFYSHYLLTFDNTGSEGTVKNIKIGTDTDKVPTYTPINDMYMQGTNAHVIYGNRVAETVD
jgi:hypothetical protein